MRVLVGSANPVKIAAVRDVFEPYFPGAEVEGIESAVRCARATRG